MPKHLFQKGHKRCGGNGHNGVHYPRKPRKRIATAIEQQKTIDNIFQLLVELPLDSPIRAKAIELMAQMEVKVKRIVATKPCKNCARRGLAR